MHARRMKPGVWGVLASAALASSAHADGPKLEARLGLGVRTSSNNSSGDNIYDETSSLRLAAEGLVGVRFGPLVVGLHGGVATPFRFSSVNYFGSGETVPVTDANIYPVDYGLGVELDTRSKVWFSGWIGATTAFTHAHSPAAMVSNIDYFGSVPEASWRYSTTSLGFGVAVDYNIVDNENGRVAAVLGVDYEGIGSVPVRDNYGHTGREYFSMTTTSLTLGVAYTY